jgi:AcrR family transcriptional regulator
MIFINRYATRGNLVLELARGGLGHSLDRVVKSALPSALVNRQLTERGRERRRQLMEFASQRFAERGYHPTSVAEIVQGMGVGKGVFYWYFSSKEELFVEILRDAQQQLRRRQQQAFGDEDDSVARIALGIRASMSWLSENRHLFTLLQFAASEERFAPSLSRGQDVAVADVAKHVKDAIAAGRVRDADPTWLAHCIIGVTNQLARTFVFEKGEPPDLVADAAVAFCLDGLVGAPVTA